MLTPEGRAVGAVSGAGYADLDGVEPDPALSGVISEDVLARRLAVPLRIEAGRLVVAMADPDDAEARGELATSAGHAVVALGAAPEAVRAAQKKLFASREATTRGMGAPATRPGLRRGGKRGERLGDILLDQGGVTREQLDQALALQREDPRELGEILLSLGHVTAGDLARALARRLHLDYVNIAALTPEEVDPDATRVLDEKTMRRYKALPLRVENGNLVVAMSDPNNLFALEDLRIIARRPIRPVVATEEDVEGAFAHLFGAPETATGEVPTSEGNGTTGLAEDPPGSAAPRAGGHRRC